MLLPERPDRIHVAFDDHRLVSNAGLLLPVTLDHHVDLGGAPGRANAGDKLLTLAASALAGGDCIDDADALGEPSKCGVRGQGATHPGMFLRSFQWGHVRQLDRVSRELLAQAWAAGSQPIQPGDTNLLSTPSGGWQAEEAGAHRVHAEIAYHAQRHIENRPVLNPCISTA